jgi:hypothetical protein
MIVVLRHTHSHAQSPFSGAAASTPHCDRVLASSTSTPRSYASASAPQRHRPPPRRGGDAAVQLLARWWCVWRRTACLARSQAIFSRMCDRALALAQDVESRVLALKLGGDMVHLSMSRCTTGSSNARQIMHVASYRVFPQIRDGLIVLCDSHQEFAICERNARGGHARVMVVGNDVDAPALPNCHCAVRGSHVTPQRDRHRGGGSVTVGARLTCLTVDASRAHTATLPF